MTDDPFSGLQLPEPPPGLRAFVLRAAHAAFSQAPRPDTWSSLAGSRTARLAWAASFVLLVALHVALPRPPHVHASSTAAVHGLDSEVSAVVTLPRIDERALAARSGERS